MKGLLFDLDGVIVDTAKYHYLAWKELADELGIVFTEKDNERLKGVSRMRSFDIILEIGGMKMSYDEKEACCTKKNEIYLKYINNMKSDETLAGVKEFISEARKNAYKIALSSASKNAALILNKLEITEYFDAVIDGTRISKAKPDPEVFIKAADEIGVAYKDCIVFEDAAAGIEAAHNAGMKAIGVGNTEIAGKADYFINGFESLSVEILDLC